MHAQPQPSQRMTCFTPLTDQEFFYFTRLGREDLLAAYIELKRHCWAGKNVCWPSAERQAQETGRKVATVRRRLEDLEQLGVIRVVHAAEAKRRGNRYILTQPDEWQSLPDVQHKRAAIAPQGADRDRRRALEPDRPRSAKQIEPREIDQEITNNQVLVAQAATRSIIQPKTKRQDVVVSQEIAQDLLAQLQQVGIEATPSFRAMLCRSATTDVERALSCLQAAKRVDNPTGYFLAALKGKWPPPVSLLAARAQKEREAGARQYQGDTDALARIWGARPGLTREDLLEDIKRDITRSHRPLVERVQEWSELGRSQAKAEASETEHDCKVQAALTATVTAGLAGLLTDAGLSLD